MSQEELRGRVVVVNHEHHFHGRVQYNAILISLAKQAIEDTLFCPDCTQVEDCLCPPDEQSLMHFNNTKLCLFEDNRFNHIEHTKDDGSKRAIFCDIDVIDLFMGMNYPSAYEPFVDKATYETWVECEAELGRIAIEQYLENPQE